MKKLLLCAVAALSLVSGALLAAPVVQIKGGMTTLILNEDTLGLLENCDVQRIKPAVQRSDGTRWRFMVSGGVLDQETYVGELEHSGGVLISCGEEQGEIASIQNLRAEYIEGELVLTAVVVVGEEPLQRLRRQLDGPRRGHVGARHLGRLARLVHDHRRAAAAGEA